MTMRKMGAHGDRRGLVTAASAVLAVGLGGCSHRAMIQPDAATAVSVTQALPVPSDADLYAVQRDTRFGPGDVLTVSVLGASDLTGEHTVDGRGMIDMPLVGEVTVLGQTSSEVAAALEQRLEKRYLRDPQVSVSAKSLNSQKVTLLGGVSQPGLYVIDGKTTLRGAIAQARGISEIGAEKDIVVFRTVNGQRLAARFDLREINGGRMVDPPLYPNDQVVVATDRNRQLFRDLAPLVPLAGIFYQIL